MKKLLAILLLVTTSLFAQGITGSGTYADPWMIYTPGNLDSMRYYLTSGTAQPDGYKIFALANDIDCDGITFSDGDTLWYPLEIVAADTFGFNGNGYEISNLDIRWDRGTHPTTSVTIEGYSGFIGEWDFGSSTPANRVDTLKNLRIVNWTMKWDSSITSVTRNPVAGLLIGRLGNGDFGGWAQAKIENVLIDSSIVWYNTSGTAYFHSAVVGGIVGWIEGGNTEPQTFEFYQVGIKNSTVYQYFNNGTSGNHTGGFVGKTGGYIDLTQCFVKYLTTYQSTSAGRLEFVGSTYHGIFAAQLPQATVILDSYIYNNTITTNGRYGGDSDKALASGWSGTSENSQLRSYIAGNTYIRLLSPTETDFLGWYTWVNGTGSITLEDNFIDTTGLSASDWYGIYGETSVISDPADTITSISAAEGIVEGTYTNFNFSTTWYISGSYNDGYPLLLWELPAIQLDAPVGGESFTFPEEININWTSQSAILNVYYSTDNGFSYTFLTTVTDDTTWIPISLSSSQFKIRITTTDSASVATSGASEYLGVVTVTMLEPLN